MIRPHPHIYDSGSLFVYEEKIKLSEEQVMEKLIKIGYPLCTKDDIINEFECSKNIAQEIINFYNTRCDYFGYNKYHNLITMYIKRNGIATIEKVWELYSKGVVQARIDDYIKDSRVFYGKFIDFIKQDEKIYEKYLQKRNEKKDKFDGLCEINKEFNLNKLNLSASDKELFIKNLLKSDKFDIMIKLIPKKN